VRFDLVPDAQAIPQSLRGQTYTVAATQGKKAQQSGKAHQARKVIATNRRARHDYTIEDTYEAGIMLTGSEVKSLRAGRASLADGYGLIIDGEIWLHGVHIPEYAQATWTNHEPRRVRKLLLHRKEIDKLERSTAEGGLTLVPLSLYFSDGKAKIELALARGRRTYDKRQALASRDAAREVERALRRRR
jgi:SsrA-binding protein